MFTDLAPPGKLIQAPGFYKITCRSRAPEVFIVGIALAHDGTALAVGAGLLGEVVEIDLTERAVVEPVVAHPAVDHRTLRHGGFQRGMRIDERHDDREAFVGAADHPNTTIRLGHILHKPIDRAVSISGVTDHTG